MAIDLSVDTVWNDNAKLGLWTIQSEYGGSGRSAGIGDGDGGVEANRSFGCGGGQQAQGGDRHKGLHGGGSDLLLGVAGDDMAVLCDKGARSF